MADRNWGYTPGDKTVPVIISKDYLSLYNFGFAGTVGMPQFSEQTISAVPLVLHIRPDNGKPDFEVTANIAGFSNRLNTILVPQEFMDWSNAEFSTHAGTPDPSRLIIDVSSPGDVKINDFMSEHNYEIAGDKAGSTASFLVNVITGVALAVGALITVLSFFILLLSISLLMQRTATRYTRSSCSEWTFAPSAACISGSSWPSTSWAYALAVGAMFLFRGTYLASIRGMGATEASPWLPLGAGLLLTLLLTLLNALSIRRRVRAAFLN